MTGPAYPAAHYVAEQLYTHFASYHSAAASRGQENLAPLPDALTIERMIDGAFWTSLRREEQHPPRISIAFASPEHATPAMVFDRPLPLQSGTLTRIAPGVERPGVHLCAWHDNGALRVWGATRALPALCFVVETVAPGLIVVKHRWSEEAAKFINVAVLEGDQIKILDDKFSNLPGCPSVLGTLLGFDFRAPATSDFSNVLIRLAVSMRAHGRGGTLLVVPNDDHGWRESIAQPMSYAVVPPYAELTEMVRTDAQLPDREGWRDSLIRAVDAVAGLTAVDGATIITSDFRVLGFGAKIVRRPGAAPLEELAITEPTHGAVPRLIHPSELGGTRHLSAAQFTFDQREALAFVASQDGPFTIFSWAACENVLFGYRVESLLL